MDLLSTLDHYHQGRPSPRSLGWYRHVTLWGLGLIWYRLLHGLEPWCFVLYLSSFRLRFIHARYARFTHGYFSRDTISPPRSSVINPVNWNSRRTGYFLVLLHYLAHPNSVLRVTAESHTLCQRTRKCCLRTGCQVLFRAIPDGRLPVLQ